MRKSPAFNPLQSVTEVNLLKVFTVIKCIFLNLNNIAANCKLFYISVIWKGIFTNRRYIIFNNNFWNISPSRKYMTGNWGYLFSRKSATLYSSENTKCVKTAILLDEFAGRFFIKHVSIKNFYFLVTSSIHSK